MLPLLPLIGSGNKALHQFLRRGLQNGHHIAVKLRLCQFADPQFDGPINYSEAPLIHRLHHCWSMLSTRLLWRALLLEQERIADFKTAPPGGATVLDRILNPLDSTSFGTRLPQPDLLFGEVELCDCF
jgi:hypothetical protein